MISTVRKPVGLLAAALLSAGMAAAALPGGAAARSGNDGGAPLVRAVVSLASSAGPVVTEGVHVVASFPRVAAELVTATPAALRRLAADPRVTGVSPDLSIHMAGRDWGGSESVLAPATLGGRAGTPQAGRGVNVALLDTGVSDTAALNRASGRITDGVDVSHLATDGTWSTSGQFTDGFGHGTFLASLIAGDKVAGSGNRGVGVAPGARVVVVKVADAQGTTYLSQVLAGLDWVAAHAQAIQVVNVALAVDRPMAPAYGADPLTAAVEHVRDSGVLVVAAAGNTPNQVGDPGMDPRALTVGAVDLSQHHTQVADFSGSGTVAGVAKPDVVAAGVHVLGVMPKDSLIYQQHPNGRQNNGLFRGSGTSEATAITSGAAAVFFSEHPGATPLEAKASLRAAADDINDPRAGAGVLELAHRVRSSADEGDHGQGSGTDWTGEASFDASSWSASSWSASSWSASSWSQWLASSWSASSWSASSWSASSWSASSWSASSWSASSWSASSWSASSWSASSWSASSWSASSWSAKSWGGEGE